MGKQELKVLNNFPEKTQLAELEFIPKQPLGWGPSFSAETGDHRAAWSLGLLAWVFGPGRTRPAEERHADTLSVL